MPRQAISLYSQKRGSTVDRNGHKKHDGISQSCLKFSHDSQHIGPVIKSAHQRVCVRLRQVAIGHCTLRKSCRQRKSSCMLTERLNIAPLQAEWTEAFIS